MANEFRKLWRRRERSGKGHLAPIDVLDHAEHELGDPELLTHSGPRWGPHDVLAVRIGGWQTGQRETRVSVNRRGFTGTADADGRCLRRRYPANFQQLAVQL